MSECDLIVKSMGCFEIVRKQFFFFALSQFPYHLYENVHLLTNFLMPLAISHSNILLKLCFQGFIKFH